MSVKFNTKFDKASDTVGHEKASTKSMVETAGYITAEQRISSLINAGQRLMDYRRAQFDLPEGSQDDPYELQPDPTRAPDFDLVDAQNIGQNLVQRANDRARAAKADTEAQTASQTAQEGSGAIENEKQG